MTDNVNSFGEALDQDEYGDPSQNENSPDPLLGESPRSGALAGAVGSQTDKQSRVSAGRDAMRSLREQYSGAAGAANEAYAQQRKALQDATQRLLSMQFGPTDKEAAYQVAAAVGTPDSAGRYNPGGINAANADVLKQQREGELQKQNLITQYGMQIPQATLGAANARMNQITQQQRIQQSENNSAESKAAAPQKLFDKYYTPDPNDPTKMVDHPEMRQADEEQAKVLADQKMKLQLGLKTFLAQGLVTPEIIDVANADMTKLPRAISSNPIAMSQVLRGVGERAQAEGNAGKNFWASQQLAKESAKVLDDYDKGKTHASLDGINTSVSHINVLRPLVTELQNGNNSIFNNIKNTWDTKVMGRPAPNNYEGVKQFVTEEISKAVMPGGGGEQERQALAQAASSASSPAILNDIINKWQALLAGKTHFAEFNWNQATQGKYGEFRDRFLLPETRKALGYGSVTPPKHPGQTAVPALAARYLPGGDLYKAPAP